MYTSKQSLRAQQQQLLQQHQQQQQLQMQQLQQSGGGGGGGGGSVAGGGFQGMTKRRRKSKTPDMINQGRVGFSIKACLGVVFCCHVFVHMIIINFLIPLIPPNPLTPFIP